MKKILASIFLFCGAHLAAIPCVGELEVALDYLYWKPAGVAQQFGEISSGGNGLTYVNRVVVDPTYQSGVRGELGWRPCSSALGILLRYSWTEPRHSQTFGGSTKARLETFYHAGDLYLAYRLCDWSCLRLELLGGGNFLYFAEVSKLASPMALDEVHVRFAGGGGSLGIGGSLTIPFCLEAFAEARAGLLFGSRMDARLESTTFFIPISNQEWTRELSLRAGGRFGWRWLSLELGWEARCYLDLMSSRQVIGEPQIGRGKAMGGPFVGLQGKF